MKRSDITDDEVLAAIRSRVRGDYKLVTELLPQYPPKLLKAKVEHMIERGLLDCGVSWNTAFEVRRG